MNGSFKEKPLENSMNRDWLSCNKVSRTFRLTSFERDKTLLIELVLWSRRIIIHVSVHNSYCQTFMDGRCLYTNNFTLIRLGVRSYMLFSQKFIPSGIC